jgi:hypothetical protein
MSNNEKIGKRLGYALGIALLFLAQGTKIEADPSPVPALETVPIEVDIARLPASEQAHSSQSCGLHANWTSYI